MSRRQALGWLFSALLILAGQQNQAQTSTDRYVYQVQAYQFPKKWPDRMQTGFLATINEQKGIITALHGVAGSHRITVRTDKGLKLNGPVKIAYIDLRHDLALLSSSEIDDISTEGIPVKTNPDWQTSVTLDVHGHPYGIKNLDTELRVRRDHAIRPLVDLLPEESQPIFRKRGSPDPDTDILSVQGVLSPGHSGAPLIDSDGNVVAVGDGGLKEGWSGICWAIPLRDISWRPYSESLIKGLLAQDPANLFAFEPTVVSEVTKYSITIMSPRPGDGVPWDYVFRLNGKEVGRFKWRGYGAEQRFTIKLPEGTHNFELRVIDPYVIPRPEFYGDFEITVGAKPARYRVIPYAVPPGDLRIEVNDLSDDN
jgi:hypothetical protein